MILRSLGKEESGFGESLAAIIKWIVDAITAAGDKNRL